MPGDTEALLRASAMTFGHIQLFRDDAGWHVSVCHYRNTPPRHDEDTLTMGIYDDPVEGLRKALMEDERRTRDLERRLAAAQGVTHHRNVTTGAVTEVVEPVQIDIEDAIAAATVADPFADMFG